MQSITINLNEAQAKFILPLLDELNIYCTHEYNLSDEDEVRLKEILESYKNGKLDFVSSAEFEAQMTQHRQDLG